MQGLSRWRGLANSKSEKDQSESRSKSKKYTPSRNQTTSEMNQKLKIINTSKINLSSVQIQNNRSRQENPLKISLIKVGQSSQMITSPIRNNQPLRLVAKTHLKPSEEQIASPTISVKMMNRLKRADQHPNGIKVSKGLFSLDEQHRYIHRQLTSIKVQFAKLKQVVMSQLMKQKKQMQQISKRIYSRLQEVIQIYSKNVPETPQFQIRDSNFMRGISIEGFMFNNQNGKETFIPEIGFSRQKSDLTESKLQLKRILGDESQRIDHLLLSNKLSQSPIKPKYQNPRSDRLYSQKNEIKDFRVSLKNQVNELKLETKNSRLENQTIMKSKSKRQFEKLFQAVKCLKNQIKGFKGVTTNLSCPIVTSFNEIKHKQSHQQGKSSQIFKAENRS